MDFPVWVSESGEGLGNRVENSLREEQIEGLNSSGFILLACISIEATTRKAMEVWIPQFIEICLRVEALLTSSKLRKRSQGCLQPFLYFTFYLAIINIFSLVILKVINNCDNKSPKM